MTERRAVIKSADMSEDMQQDAVDCTSMALEKYNIEKVSERLLRHDSRPFSCIHSHSLSSPLLAFLSLHSGYRCLHQEGV
jgi:hypothetical protein